MEVELLDYAVEVDGDANIRNVTVENPNLILEYLRSGIYSNPKRIICQEIISNARDAHREVGTPELPVWVKLPNKFSPTWEVRDFGPGISPTRMDDIYKNVTASSKRNDSLQTGGFGIGSKTPWAYTDNFIIKTIAREDNQLVRREYAAVIGEGGSCQIIEFDESYTIIDEFDETIPPEDRRTGTTIIINVEVIDYCDFCEYSRKVTEFWDVKPTFFGEYPFAESNYEVKFSHKNVQLINREITFCLVDNIPYPIDYRSWHINNRSDIKSLLNKLLIRFETGEVDVAVSREALKYSPKTNLAIQTAVEGFVEAYRQNAQLKLDNCSSLWDAIVLRQQYKDFKLNYKNQELPHNINFGYDARIMMYDRNNQSIKKFKSNYIVPSHSSAVCLLDGAKDIANRLNCILEQNSHLTTLYYVDNVREDLLKEVSHYIKYKLSEINYKKTKVEPTELISAHNAKSYYRSYLNKSRSQKVDPDELIGYYVVSKDHSDNLMRRYKQLGQIIDSKADIWIISPRNQKKLSSNKNISELNLSLKVNISKLSKTEIASRILLDRFKYSDFNGIASEASKESKVFTEYENFRKFLESYLDTANDLLYNSMGIISTPTNSNRITLEKLVDSIVAYIRLNFPLLVNSDHYSVSNSHIKSYIKFCEDNLVGDFPDWQSILNNLEDWSISI